MWADFGYFQENCGAIYNWLMTFPTNVQGNKSVVYDLHHKFDIKLKRGCLMNLKVLLGLKFGLDHTCYPRKKL